MANVVKISYKRTNYDKLLKELNKAAGSAQPAPQLETPAATATDHAAALKQSRRQLLKNPENRFFYSTKHRLLHDHDCPHIKEISDEHLRMLPKFPTDMRYCNDCYRRALLRAGLESNAARQMITYENTLLRLGASNQNLRTLTVENGAKFCGVGVDKVQLKVHDDTWEIRKKGDVLLLYHNNYTVTDNYERCFDGGFHLQRSSVGDNSFYYFTTIMVGYSWPDHVKLLKEQEAERQRQQRKEFLAQVFNFEKLNRFSLLFDTYICLDCNGKLPRFFHRNRVCTKELAYQSRMNTYALRLYRVPIFHRHRFRKALEDLKEYSIVADFPEYGPNCTEKIYLNRRNTHEKNHHAVH